MRRLRAASLGIVGLLALVAVGPTLVLAGWNAIQAVLPAILLAAVTFYVMLIVRQYRSFMREVPRDGESSWERLFARAFLSIGMLCLGIVVALVTGLVVTAVFQKPDIIAVLNIWIFAMLLGTHLMFWYLDLSNPDDQNNPDDAHVFYLADHHDRR